MAVKCCNCIKNNIKLKANQNIFYIHAFECTVSTFLPKISNQKTSVILRGINVIITKVM